MFARRFFKASLAVGATAVSAAALSVRTSAPLHMAPTTGGGAAAASAPAPSPCVPGLNKEDWIEKWRKAPGWHTGRIHPALEVFCSQFGNPSQSRVLVPLCGAAKEVTWLASKGHRVVGIEFAEEAVEKLFNDAALSHEDVPTAIDGVQIWRNSEANIDVAIGDYFAVSSDAIGSFDAVWDRGSLVAVSPTVQERYVDHLLGLVKEGGKIIFVAMDYDQSKMNGPPFSISKERVLQLYGKRATVEHVATIDALAPRFSERGLTTMWEQIYIITKTTPNH